MGTTLETGEESALTILQQIQAAARGECKPPELRTMADYIDDHLPGISAELKPIPGVTGAVNLIITTPAGHKITFNTREHSLGFIADFIAGLIDFRGKN